MIYYFQSITRSESSRLANSLDQLSAGPNPTLAAANFNPLTLGSICLNTIQDFTGTSVGIVLQLKSPLFALPTATALEQYSLPS